ncbi:hypothetical protein [Corynebacterium macclintockiae]|uniref:hypothetical protein n=1 Tax=Corynebacterium macclintockiae TaxID=2913501 RepID=UPI003EBB403B
MTSNQQQLAKLEQHAKELAEQIKQLQDQLNNAQPTTGLLGRWATHPEYGDVLIAGDKSDNGLIQIVYLSSIAINGTYSRTVNIDDLTFPGQATRPQDVPAGEAWLIDADDGDYSTTNTPALKIDEGLWTSRGLSEWTDDEVELITPLIPALPHDTPETVTTEEEYGKLPEGSIVAKPGEDPWTHKPYVWEQRGAITDDMMLSGTTRHVLRHGWGTSPANS